jgi:hypothetical protein
MIHRGTESRKTSSFVLRIIRFTNYPFETPGRGQGRQWLALALPRIVSNKSRFQRLLSLASLIPEDDGDTFIVSVLRSPSITGRLQFQDVITGFILFDYSFREDRELGVPGNPYSDKMTASCSFRQIQGVKQHEQVKHQGCSCKLTSNAVDWIVTRAVSSPPMRAF